MTVRDKVLSTTDCQQVLPPTYPRDVRGVTVRDKVLSTTDCQQTLSPTYPRDVMFETKALKTKSTTLTPSFLYQHGHVLEKGARF